MEQEKNKFKKISPFYKMEYNQYGEEFYWGDGYVDGIAVYQGRVWAFRDNFTYTINNKVDFTVYEDPELFRKHLMQALNHYLNTWYFKHFEGVANHKIPILWDQESIQMETEYWDWIKENAIITGKQIHDYYIQAYARGDYD
jgi:hypothetical protein